MVDVYIMQEMILASSEFKQPQVRPFCFYASFSFASWIQFVLRNNVHIPNSFSCRFLIMHMMCRRQGTRSFYMILLQMAEMELM